MKVRKTDLETLSEVILAAGAILAMIAFIFYAFTN